MIHSDYIFISIMDSLLIVVVLIDIINSDEKHLSTRRITVHGQVVDRTVGSIRFLQYNLHK